MIAPVKTWRFSEPNRNGEGWWIAFIDEAGCFSVLSDFGDYAYRWPSSPESLGAPNLVRAAVRFDGGYVLQKLADNDWFDAEATEKAVKQALVSRDDREVAEVVRIGNEFDLHTAVHDYDLHQEAMDGELARYDYPPQAREFIKQIWPRIVEQLKAAIERGDA